MLNDLSQQTKITILEVQPKSSLLCSHESILKISKICHRLYLGRLKRPEFPTKDSKYGRNSHKLIDNILLTLLRNEQRNKTLTKQQRFYTQQTVFHLAMITDI